MVLRVQEDVYRLYQVTFYMMDLNICEFWSPGTNSLQNRTALKVQKKKVSKDFKYCIRKYPFSARENRKDKGKNQKKKNETYKKQKE